MALNCKVLGANSTWSPVVDLPSRFAVSGIMRTSSDKPDHMVPISLAVVKGRQGNGIGMCAKHFPGKEEWWKEQGKVFQDMIDGGVWSIMPGH